MIQVPRADSCVAPSKALFVIILIHLNMRGVAVHHQADKAPFVIETCAVNQFYILNNNILHFR